jgi:hypothetical protein
LNLFWPIEIKISWLFGFHPNDQQDNRSIYCLHRVVLEERFVKKRAKRYPFSLISSKKHFSSISQKRKSQSVSEEICRPNVKR